jgi:hypothetical protein
MLKRSVVVKIPQGQKGTAFFCSRTKRHVIRLDQPGFGYFIKPIGVRSKHCPVIINIFSQINIIELGVSVGIVTPIEAVTDIVTVRITASVYRCLPQSLSVFARIEHLHAVIKISAREKSIESQLDSSGLSLFGSNNDNPVGGT